MEDLLRQVEEKIAYARYWRSALAELEVMAEKLRQMIAAQPTTPGVAGHTPAPFPSSPQPQSVGGDDPTDVPRPGQPSGNGRSASGHANADLSNASIKTAAYHILSSTGIEWMDVADIAERAIAGGYRSPKYGADLERVAYYFLDTLRRDRDTFERRGRRYRLAPGAESSELVGNHGRPGGRPLADRITEVLEQSDEPMRIQEIIEELRKTGFPEPDRPGAFYTAIYSVLDRSNSRFERVDKGLWGLADRGAPANGTAHPTARDAD